MFLRLAVFSLFLGALVPSAATALPADQDDGLDDAGVYSPQWFAELQDVELVGDRAYVYGVGGLAIFDISDIDAPSQLGRYEPPGHPYNRFYRGGVGGSLVVGGGRNDLLSVIDVSDPTLPALLSIYGIKGQSFEGAVIDGTLAYACVHDDGLEVVDLADPLNPTLLAAVPGLVNAWDVELSGGYAFVADGLGGLAVVDITTPAAASLVTTAPTSGAAVDVTLSGDLAAVCNGSAGVDLFDVSNPAVPFLLATVNTSALAITAAFAGDTLFVADWDDVEAFDVSNPALPVAAGGENTPVRAMGLDARPGLVVVADWSRLRLYRPGPTAKGDLNVPVEGIDFGMVPFGAVVDTTITLGNTGAAPVTVSEARDFSPNFSLSNTGPFTILPGDTLDLTITFNHAEPGYDATFVRIDSDDSDEPSLTFPLSGDDNQYLLDVGNPAPDWARDDIGGVFHQLSDYQGKVVVMAFFADW